MRLTTLLASLTALVCGCPAAELRLNGPFTHDNLSIYLVHAPDRSQTRYLTLAEALDQHKVVVYETGNVNQLQVENVSKEDIYIQSGEIVKGGRQDRVLKDDFILPTASGKVDITAFCVEQGRWTGRGNESSQAFEASPNAIASPQMKRAVQSGQQQQVWVEVAAAQASIATSLNAPVKARQSPTSYQLTVESEHVKKVGGGFQKELGGLASKYGDAIGYVMVVNGKVTGSDVYASHELFRKLWPKLLEAASVEAMAAARPGQSSTAPSMDEVRAAATGYGAHVAEEKQLNRRTNTVKAELPTGTVVETRDSAAPSAPVHRTYVVK